MRLWTSSRSKRGTPQCRRDSSIWDGPRPPEEIQTLSAEKSCDGWPSLLRPYPITSCEEPYIGEESMTRPPSWKKAPMTSAQESRAETSSPTLNVIQLPRPTSGSRSPVEGIARVRIVRDWAAAVGGRRTEAAPAAAREDRKARRLSVGGGGIRIFYSGGPRLVENGGGGWSFRPAGRGRGGAAKGAPAPGPPLPVG